MADGDDMTAAWGASSGDAPQMLSGAAEVKINYDTVTKFIAEMERLKRSVDEVRTAILSLNKPDVKTALGNLGMGGPGGTAGSTITHGQFTTPTTGTTSTASTFGDEEEAAPGGTAPPRTPNGGGSRFGAFASQYGGAAIAIGGAAAIIGSYAANRRDANLFSDVTSIRSVMTSSRPTFGLRQASQQMVGGMALGSAGREDMIAGYGQLIGRYGTAQSTDLQRAMGGSTTFALTGMQGQAYGAEMYNRLNAPQVLNTMRAFTGYATTQADPIEAMRRMQGAIFNGRQPSIAQLSEYRPGTPLYTSMQTLTAGDQELSASMVDMMRLQSQWQQKGMGTFNEDSIKRMVRDERLERQVMGGERSLTVMQQREDERIARIDEEVFQLSRAGMISVEDNILAIRQLTDKGTKYLASIAEQMGTLAAGVAGPAGVAGSIGDVASTYMMWRMFKGGGMGGAPAPGMLATAASRGGRVGAVAGRVQGLGGLGRFAARGAGGLLAGQMIDDMVGNPANAEGIDAGNIARYGVGGAAVGGLPGAGIGLAAGVIREGGHWLSGKLGITSSSEELAAARARLERQDPNRDTGWFSGGWNPLGDPVGGPGSPVATPAGVGGGRGNGGTSMSVMQAEQILLSRNNASAGSAAVRNLRSDFKVQLATMFLANPRLSLTSGWRDKAQQAQLYNDYINGVPGQAPAAPPGKSNHEYGLAADIGPESEYGWMMANYKQFGLEWPMSYEPWHYQPSGVTSGSYSGEGGSTEGYGEGEGGRGGRRAGGGRNGGGTTLIGASARLASGRMGTTSQAELVQSLLGPPSVSGRAISGGGQAGYGVAGGSGAGGQAEPWDPGAGALTINQAARYARAAGVPDDQIVTAVAIAMAESGLNPRAHNPNPPDDSYGLWQINMIGTLGPDRRETYGLRSNEELWDPAANARAMMGISSGGSSWSPWTTYTSGKYEAHIGQVQQALSTGVGDPVRPSGATSPSVPSIVTAVGGGSGTKVVAAINLYIMRATDDEVMRAARTIKEHIEMIQVEENARVGL